MRTPLWLIGLGGVLTVATLSLIFVEVIKKNSQPGQNPQVVKVTNSPGSVTAADIPIESQTPAVSTTATPTIAASSESAASPKVQQTSITPAPVLNTVLANFYTAYKERDRTRLSSYFSSDNTSVDADLRRSLFLGSSPSGGGSGLYLFQDAAVAEWVLSYQVLGTAQQTDGWIYTIEENRSDLQGFSRGRISLIYFVKASPGESGWLISSYTPTVGGNKYSGFFTQAVNQ